MTVEFEKHDNAAIGAATVHSQVAVPLRVSDGFTVAADVLTFDGLADGKEHMPLSLGQREQALLHPVPQYRAPLVRLHSECLTGDVSGSQRCGCGPQLLEGVREIAAAGEILLYLRQEGQGHRPVFQA